MATYFTADSHLNHASLLRNLRPGFASIEEHDELLIEAWNSTVRPGDTVYHLGDFSLSKDPAYLARTFRRLNGRRKVLVVGNHDRRNRQLGWDEQHEGDQGDLHREQAHHTVPLSDAFVAACLSGVAPSFRAHARAAARHDAVLRCRGGCVVVSARDPGPDSGEDGRLRHTAGGTRPHPVTPTTGRGAARRASRASRSASSASVVSRRTTTGATQSGISFTPFTHRSTARGSMLSRGPSGWRSPRSLANARFH